MKTALRVYYVLRSLLLRGPFNSWLLWRGEQNRDQALGISTSGFVQSLSAQNKHYQGASYYVLDRIFKQLAALVPVTTAFVDIGCGMGRVLAVARQRGFRKITGIEIDPALAEQAKQNLSRAGLSGIEVIQSDATEYHYHDGSCVYFLFNPFGVLVLQKVLHRIIADNDREVWIVYMNPVHRSVFDQKGLKPVQTLKTGLYTEALFYRIKAYSA